MLESQIGATAAYSFAHFGIKGTFDDYVWCFQRLAELGFHNFNLEILEEEHVDLFTTDRVLHFRKLGEKFGINLDIFTTYYSENDLTSMSAERRKKGLDKFLFSVKTAKHLGSTIINMASEFPPELVDAYRPEYVHSPAGRFRIPADVSWQSIWETHVATIRACADMAAADGLRFSLEPRANCLVSTTDSFLRLAEHVDRPNFGCSLDILHAHYQREDIPTAIRKLGPQLIDIQVSGADGETMKHLPMAEGSVDYGAMVRALDDIGFTGLVGLEIMVGDIDQAYRDGRLMLEQLCSKASASVKA